MQLTETGAQVLGYLGGGILALGLVPQIVKLVRTRSAGDIAITYVVLYAIGLAFTLAYLVFEGAIAAWIPLVFESAGCLTILTLKLIFDHTRCGRRPGADAGAKSDASVIVADGGAPAASAGGEGGGAVRWQAAADHVSIDCGGRA
ncbi:MAG: hypothetical protein J3K34DRAFT_424982 [Monoraphidium minutum]|nr:MAG: hypothetical protein J3K34DRAFT_424982 [Monoraphidium minutum]